MTEMESRVLLVGKPKIVERDFNIKFYLDIPRWFPYQRILCDLRYYTDSKGINLTVDDCGGLLFKHYSIRITGCCEYTKIISIKTDIDNWFDKLGKLWV